jgi:hypothetical protein
MGLINLLTRNTYLPICRLYAKHVVSDEPADVVMQLLTGLYFLKVHKYWPWLTTPRSFEEKVTNRMLFDRNPLWTLLSDKLASRDYIAARVGSNYLVPLLWSGEDPAAIPFDHLPDQFVLKTNHGCGYNIIVTNRRAFDAGAAVRQLKVWLAENFGESSLLGTGWGYRNIPRGVLVEEFVGTKIEVPVDYKFFCFDGRAELLQMNFDRFGRPFEKFFDRDHTPLDVWNGTRQYPHPVSRPERYDEMLCLAEALSFGLDFLRVDLYCVGDKVYVGELTCYPGGGNTPFRPRSFDFDLGARWRIADPSRSRQSTTRITGGEHRDSRL